MPTTTAPSPTRNLPLPALIDAHELARLLNVTVGLIRRMTCEGKIPAHKLGHRTVRYDLANVLAALGRNAPEPPPAAPRPRPVPCVAPVLLSDLPAYDWSTSPPPDATLLSADRRGSGAS